MSVALAMLLADAELGRHVLNVLSQHHAWTMWDPLVSPFATKPFEIPSDAEVQASSLFFPFRDAALQDQETEDNWRGEIDVVVLIPNHLVIGIELKVLSTSYSLNNQLKQQVSGLKLLKDRYHCKYISQVALTKNLLNSVSLHVNRLTYHELAALMPKIGNCINPRDVLSIFKKQLDHAIFLTGEYEWNPATLDEMMNFAVSEPSSPKWIGVLEGLENIKIDTRRFWKVAEGKKSSNWYPIKDVVDRIKNIQALERAKAP